MIVFIVFLMIKIMVIKWNIYYIFCICVFLGVVFFLKLNLIFLCIYFEKCIVKNVILIFYFVIIYDIFFLSN